VQAYGVGHARSPHELTKRTLTPIRRLVWA
jgi:hypothetical protein